MTEDELATLLLTPLAEEFSARIRLAKCLHCHRRPVFRTRPGADMEIEIGDGDQTKLRVPRYEVVPCCSARYVVRHDQPSRLERIRARERKV